MSMRKIVILQARLASSRFPNKVLAELCGKPLIAHIVERLKAAKQVDGICVAIPADASEDPLAAALSHYGVTITRGHANDVLGRYIQAAYQTGAEVIVRATADNPLVSPENIDRQLGEISADPSVDYLITDGYPVGVTTETFTLKTLEKLDFLARDSNMREHVTLYLRHQQGSFNVKHLKAPEALAMPDLRFSLDTPSDYDFLKAVYERLYKPGSIVDLGEAIELVKHEPSLLQAAVAA
jgi:spore coat polysaccharide biosynthesis protein SpsF